MGEDLVAVEGVEGGDGGGVYELGEAGDDVRGGGGGGG